MPLPSTPLLPGNILELGPPVQTLEEVERDYIRHVPQHCAGNQTQAARLLALNRNTLRWRMKSWV